VGLVDPDGGIPVKISSALGDVLLGKIAFPEHVRYLAPVLEAANDVAIIICHLKAMTGLGDDCSLPTVAL
jgi:hypothetical protein